MTGIEWTDETWNPTTGCDRVSPGCDNCYALTMAARLKGMGQPKYQNDGDPRTSGPGFGLTVHPDTLDVPFRWRKPRRVFVNSMSDLFHKEVPEEFIARVWTTMRRADRHVFQVLTKRPQRMSDLVARMAWRTPYPDERDQGARGFVAYAWPAGFGDANQGQLGPYVLPNVWLGTSIESDRYAWRADHLRATPAAVRWLSLEPLLGPLPSLDLTGIDWVVVGGESGPGARPMHPDWARDIRDRCVDAGVPFFFKQHGAWTWSDSRPRMSEPDLYLHPDGRTASDAEAAADGGTWQGMFRVGKAIAGRELDDRTWDEMPGVPA